MTLQASALSSPSPLNAIFDLLGPKTATKDVSPLVAIPVANSQQQPTEQQYLVSRIDDLCDCV